MISESNLNLSLGSLMVALSVYKVLLRGALEETCNTEKGSLSRDRRDARMHVGL